MPHPLLCVLLCSLLWLPTAGQAQVSPALPSLGDSSSALVSPEDERRLGQVWLGLFRSQAPVVDDPLLQDYLEHLVQELAFHSELQDRRLSLVIVDNRTLNAFAVPGGVIGIHNGLLLQAPDEDQFASVIAHELAHLSQRHFARTLEQARRQQMPAMAGLLASIILAATAGPDAGMAAMAATQAAVLQNQLRYSRQYEQEADRIGMQTLHQAGRDPFAFARMFETMQRTLRFAGSRPPEFLLTHPVTESRISDARSRAVQLSGRMLAPLRPADGSDYPLMRARIRLQVAETPGQAVRDFRALLDSSPEAAPERYGLALALLANNQAEAAADTLAPLLRSEPMRLPYVLAQAQIDLARGRAMEAEQLLRRQLAINPGNHPLLMHYSDLLQQQRRYGEALQLLRTHSLRRPQDPAIWYRLAELHGLAGNIRELHQARAEYFILNGRLDEAERHLQYARRLAAGDYPNTAVIDSRLQDVAAMKAAMRALRL